MLFYVVGMTLSLIVKGDYLTNTLNGMYRDKEDLQNYEWDKGLKLLRVLRPFIYALKVT